MSSADAVRETADRQSTLVFAVNVPAILSLTNTFRQAGVDARFIYERTPIVERREILAAFKAGEFPVLVNCGEVFCIHSQKAKKLIPGTTGQASCWKVQTSREWTAS